MAEIRYEMLEVLSFWDRERVLPPSIKITLRYFLVEIKSAMKLSGFFIFEENTKNLQPICLTRARPRI